MSMSAGRPPPLSTKAISNVVCKYFNFKNVYEDSLKTFPSYDDRNYYFRGERLIGNGSEFVLKLNNPVYTSFEVTQELNVLMQHVHSCGFQFSTPYPLPSKAGPECVQLTASELMVETSEDITVDNKICANNVSENCLNNDSEDSTNESTTVASPVTATGSNFASEKQELRYPVRVLAYVSGEVFDTVEKKLLSPALLCKVGEMLGSIGKELKENFSNEILESRKNPYWDLKVFGNVKVYLQDIDDSRKRRNAETVFDYIEERVAPRLPTLGKGIIHGDVNGLNIILSRKLPASDICDLSGLIDFGDCAGSCTIFDLGICLAYIMLENMDPIYCSSAVEFVGPLIHGYNSILPLTPDEFDCLYYLVLARCVQSALNGQHAFKAEPWNDYLLITPNKAWKLVDTLLSTSKIEVDRIWKTFTPGISSCS